MGPRRRLFHVPVRCVPVRVGEQHQRLLVRESELAGILKRVSSNYTREAHAKNRHRLNDVLFGDLFHLPFT
jgi:hypothetical protein